MPRAAGSKKRTGARRGRTTEDVGAKGFDFAERPLVMAVADPSFIQALREARVFACAYGFQSLPGFRDLIPRLTLVGEDRQALEKAFAIFATWGCEQDGDAVDIGVLLKPSGGYELWISPELDRLVRRAVPQPGLSRPLAAGISWVKRFDTTQPFLLELKSYCASPMTPVVITAGTCDSRHPDLSRIAEIAPLPRLVKFDLKVLDEAKDSSDPRFHVVRDGLKQPASEATALTPQEYCEFRRQTIDRAFPISRERVRRADLLSRVRAESAVSSISETQVVQAAVNLMLSGTIVPGDCHYQQIPTAELADRIWTWVTSRFETATNLEDPSIYQPAAIATQIALDIMHVLTLNGIPFSRGELAALQPLFRSSGYVDD